MDIVTTRSRRLVELPTLLVAAAIYGGFGLVTWHFHDWPRLLTLPLATILIAWHGSLQHETIHGHPFRSRRLNALLGGIPLSLWLPYAIYRSSHLYHHRFEGRLLTDPWQDPESYYLKPGALARMSAPLRALRIANTTLLGRMLFGPAFSMLTFLAREARALAAGDRRAWRIWSLHALTCIPVLAWVIGVCHISLLAYFACFVYPGTSLARLRSFAEHRANVEPAQRTAVVEANPVISTIFLYNNYHVVHHALPGLPWYAIGSAWRQMKSRGEDAEARRAGLVYPGGYVEIVRRYLLSPVIRTEYPLTPPATASGEALVATATR
jgi:fatty acid desaturase